MLQVSYTGLLAFLRSQVVGREEKDRVGRQRETRGGGISKSNFCHLTPDVSSYGSISAGPFPVLVSSELPETQISFLWFPLFADNSQAQGVQGLLCSGLSHPPQTPPQAFPLPGFCSSRSSWSSAPIGCSLAFLLFWWFRTSLPSV